MYLLNYLIFKFCNVFLRFLRILILHYFLIDLFTFARMYVYTPRPRYKTIYRIILDICFIMSYSTNSEVLIYIVYKPFFYKFDIHTYVHMNVYIKLLLK